MMSLSKSRLALLALLVVLVPLQSSAETVRRDAGGAAGGDAALRKAQYMLRELNQEKTELEARNAELGKELAELQADLEKAGQQKKKTEAKLKRSEGNNDQLVARVKQDREKMQQMVDKYRETAMALRDARQDNALLTNAVKERNHWMDTCQEKNEQMYEANMELLERYKNKGLWRSLSQAEPLTGLGEIAVENVVEEYQFRLEDLTVNRPRFTTANSLESGE